MSASAAMVSRLRLMVNEPTTVTYSDADLVARIEVYPLTDSNGVEPSAAGWVATYDLNQVASEVWMEKAGALAANYSFAADGASFQRGQLYDHAVAMSKQYADLVTQAKKRKQQRKAGSYKMVATPAPIGASGYVLRENVYQGNASEPEPFPDALGQDFPT